MHTVLAAMLCLVVGGVLGQGPTAGREGGPARLAAEDGGEAVARAQPRFEAIDIYLDSGEAPLAAWQVEIKAAGGGAGDVKAVGIEGGEAAVFKGPPFYDPAALHEDQLRERVILAAYSTEGSLPKGRVRVARVHVQVRGPAPEYTATVMTAGTADGSRIEAKVEIMPAPQAQPGDGR